ncbi:hypothetical protein [Streptosporangium sp. KLBMP 9127]|nr:hypothetical protein [Streptosporangium sp. KLBMP 9127]
MVRGSSWWGIGFLAMAGGAVVLGWAAGLERTSGGVFLVLALVIVALIAHTYLKARERAATEEHLLAVERERVRQSILMVMDPALTEDERLAVVDGFIPRLREAGLPDPRHGPCRDRFVLVADLARSSRELMDRARKAAFAIRDSKVTRLRMLDGVANDRLLPQQIWEIARLLRMQSELAVEQAQAVREMVTPELTAVLEPQKAVLRRSVEAVSERVAALEGYALRVRAADAALRAREALDNNEKYRELLAHADDAAELRQLAAHGEALEQALASSVREAIEAGRTLSVR